MKWQAGTIEDLAAFGLNRLTWRYWGQQAMGLLNATARALWLFVILGSLSSSASSTWRGARLPVLVHHPRRVSRHEIPHRARTDLPISGSFFPNGFFMWLRAGWFVAACSSVLWNRATNRKIDRWAAQYAGEGGH